MERYQYGERNISHESFALCFGRYLEVKIQLAPSCLLA